MKLLEKYNKFATEKGNVMEVVTSVMKDAFPFLILVLNVIVSVVFSLYDPSIKNPWSADFFVRLITNILTTMVCYSCFVNYGEKNQKLSSDSYAANIKKWSEMSAKVRQNCADKFMMYCRKQVEIEREEIRHFYILNNTMITLEEYEAKYKRLSDEQIDKLHLKGELHRKEAKYIKKANKTRYLKPINPILILCGVNKMSLNDVGRDGVSSSTMAIAMRPAMMFAISTVGAMLSATWKGIDSASALFNIVWSILMIVWSSIVGYSAGSDAGRKEMDKIKGRIFFLERYLATEEKAEQ